MPRNFPAGMPAFLIFGVASEVEPYAEPDKSAIPCLVGESILNVSEGGKFLKSPEIESSTQSFKPFIGVELITDAADRVGSQLLKKRYAVVAFRRGVVEEGPSEIGPIGCGADPNVPGQEIGCCGAQSPLVPAFVNIVGEG